MRIVFMGTPEFSAYCLAQLLKNQYTIVGVVTVADKPAGRGKKLNESAVKQMANQYQLPLVQPDKLRDAQFIQKLKSWNADIYVVVAFRMLPDIVWKIPHKGTFNLHASLLPQYRGAAPINWALINGETQTGITTFMIDEQIDTGKILLQETIEISPNMTAGELHDEMAHKGAALIMKTIDALKNDKLLPLAQTNSTQLKNAPKLYKEDGQINWKKSIETIHNHVRGFSPYPAAWTFLKLNDQLFSFKILRTAIEYTSVIETPLTVIRYKKGLKIAFPEAYLHIIEGQLEGKKPQTALDLVNGIANYKEIKIHS